MKKILSAELCDSLGNTVKTGGSLETLNDFSGSDKRDDRLIFRLKVKLEKKRRPIECVVKISEFTNNNSYFLDYRNKKLGKYLDNSYLHEILIYQEMNKLPDYENNIMKCYGSGITTNNDFTIKGETFNFSESKQIMENLPLLGSRKGYIYLVTEYNPAYKMFNKRVQVPKNMNKFVISTLTILNDIYNKYSFCHWDFHYNGNILFNENNNELILFDFDLSTINTVPNSQYTERVPFFKLFLDYVEEPNIIKMKNHLGHYLDIFNFLISLEYNYNLDDASKINVPGYDMKHLIDSFNRAKDNTQYIFHYLNELNTQYSSEVNTLLKAYKIDPKFEESLEVLIKLSGIKRKYPYYDYVVEYFKIGLHSSLSDENILTGPNYDFNVNCFTALIMRNIYTSKLVMCLDRGLSECEKMNKAYNLNLGIKQCKLVDNVCVPDTMKTITEGYKSTYKKRTKKYAK